MDSDDKHLLIVWHSRTGASEALANAALSGALEEEPVAPPDRGDSPLVRARMIPAAQVTNEDLLAASAYLFVCPENLASMSGMMKEMFDRTYYGALGAIEGRAYATIIAAGSDGEGAQRQIDRITSGWRLKRVADPLIVNLGAQSVEEILAEKAVPDDALLKARDMGAILANGCAMGLF